ncbi:MAG TPA: hypothetical protein DCQ06_08075 [Myxococcales bacterium]|nr:hypothetical protein [Myxococcales bacterium]
MPDLSTKPKKKPDPKDLADPKLRDKHSNDQYGYTSAGTDERNKLFYYGIKPTDVYQGAIADCYFVSALAAVAAEAPDLIKNGIVDNGDNTYKVRFFRKKDYWSSTYESTWVTVDGDLPSRAGSDSPMYAKGQKTRTGGRELWPGIVEKAWAEFKGGYNEMGEGGSTAGALEALSGSRVSYSSTDTTPEDTMWLKLRKATVNDQAMAAGTRGKDEEALYKGTNLYPWHAYTVLGAYEKGSGKNRKRIVKLRNPWGRVEPGQDGKDDGIFELTLEDFMKFYSSVNIANM